MTRNYSSEYPLKVGDVLKERYEIVNVLGGGMRGSTFRGIDRKSSRDIIIKIPNLDISGRYPQSEIENRLRVVQGDVEREFRAWERLRKNPETATVIADVYEIGTELIMIQGIPYLVPFIVQEFIEGEGLEDWCKTRYSINSQFRGISQRSHWFEIARKLTHIIGLVHEERIVHGDIWPPNIIMRKTQEDSISPVLIDFGQAWFLEQEFDKESISLTARYQYYAPERNHTGLTWYSPVDIYALGGVLYYLATGEKPPSAYTRESGDLKPHSDLKAEVIKKISKNNRTLYDSNIGIADIILYCMRPKVEDRAAFAGAVIELMNLFETAFQEKVYLKPKGKAVARNLSDAAHKLEIINNQPQTANNLFFHRMVDRDIRLLKTKLDTITSRLYHLTGDRENLVNGLLACVSCLQKNDQILALTTPQFWAKHNFGTNGRFLTILKMAAINGVNIRWIMVLSQEEFDSEDVKSILKVQKSALQELRSRNVDIKDTSLNGQGFYIGYRIDDKERVAVTKEAKTFIVLNKKNDNKDYHTLVAPAYTRTRGNIALMRFWHEPTRWESEFRPSLENHLAHSKAIRNL